MDPPFYFGDAVDDQHFTGHQWLMEKSIKSYHLNSSGNVGRICKSLTKKEIIVNKRGATLFLNPIYKYWLREYYFR
jgi:hypothetical protein